MRPREDVREWVCNGGFEWFFDVTIDCPKKEMTSLCDAIVDKFSKKLRGVISFVRKEALEEEGVQKIFLVVKESESIKTLQDINYFLADDERVRHIKLEHICSLYDEEDFDEEGTLKDMPTEVKRAVERLKTEAEVNPEHEKLLGALFRSMLKDLEDDSKD